MKVIFHSIIMKIKTKQRIPCRLTPLARLGVQRLWLEAQDLGMSQASNHVWSLSSLNKVTEGQHEVGRNALSLSLSKRAHSGEAQTGGDRKGFEIAQAAP